MNEEEIRDNNKEQAADRLATAALVMGIISLISTFCCCPFIFSALGIILALLSKGAEQVLRPRAKTGLILSIVGFVVSIILIVFTIGFPIFMFKTNPQYKEIMIEQYEQYIDQNKDMIEDIYGEGSADEMKEIFESIE